MSKQDREAESEVGDRYSLSIEKHKAKPLWRLRERSVVKGKPFEHVTKWIPYSDFTPELGMAQGRLRYFLFGEMGLHPPQANRRT